MPDLSIEKLRLMADIAIDETSGARELSELCRDYYDGYQYTAAEEAILKKRKQPIITVNRTRRKIDAMIGIEQQGRNDPRAYPRTPKDEQAADAATKALVYVDDITRFDSKRSAAFENVLVEGYGGVEVAVEMKRGVAEVAIHKLRWEEIFADPYSREKDFSDASYLGVMKWMTIDTAMDLYQGLYEGDLQELLDQTMKFSGDSSYEDRPTTQVSRWADPRQKRVRVAQMYVKTGGEWRLAIFCGGGIIHQGVSGYMDEDGKPVCPIILFTGYIDRENRRYGVVKDLLPIQDEINKRRSKLLNQLNSRQTIGVKGAVDSVEAMKRQLATPDGHVDVNIEAFEDAARVGMKPFDIVQNADQTAGQFSLLQEAKAEIDMLGPNASLLGQLQGRQSGRAILAQQQAGYAELAPIYDSLNDWTIRVYREVWRRIRQFWTEERWVRVTDDIGAVEFVGLNVNRGTEVVYGPDGMPSIRPIVENAVADMDVDIIVDSMPDVATLRQEEFAQLADMVAKGVQIPPEVLIEASTLRNKKDILDKIEERRAEQMQMLQMQAQQAQGASQQQLQLTAMATQAKAERDRAAARKDVASAGKIQTDTVIKQITGQG